MLNKLFGNKNKASKEESVTLEVTGMTCDHCETSVEKLLAKVRGFLSAEVNWKKGTASVHFDADKTSQENLISSINVSKSYQAAKSNHTNILHKDTGNSQVIGGSGSQYDLIIIGGGSAAFSAAINSNELGLRTLMVNAGLPVGGTCVNVGCVPSKHLIRAAEQVHKASYSPFRGVKVKKPELDFKAIIQQKKELVSDMQKKKYLGISDNLEQLTMLNGWAEFVDANTIMVDGTKYRGLKFLIATGSTTNVPDIPGLEEAGYLTNVSLFDSETLPESLIILGAGYIALEIAQAYRRFGSKVTILHRSERILRSEAKDITDELTKFLIAEGIKIHTNTQLERVSRSGNEVILDGIENGQAARFRGTHVLVATGTQANTSRLNAKAIGLELEETGHIKVNEKLQTSVAHIYAAGDCTSSPAFVYTAAKEAKTAIRNAFAGEDNKVDYSSLPWVVFTDPQVAGAGMDEIEAQAKGIPYEVNTIPLTEVPRAIAALDTRGFIKMIRNPDTDKLLGVRILAPEGGELATQASLAIKYGITVTELAEHFHPYLTMSEGLKLTALTFSKDIAELSCCAS